MSNQQLVYDELINLGWKPHQVAGLIGRLQQESGRALNSTILGDNGNSYGIAQWNGNRRAALRDFAAENGFDMSDPVAQARFINHELRGSEGRAGSALQNASTVEDAAKAAMMYERPSGFTWDNPTAGHGWNNTLRNARALAQPGVTLNSTPEIRPGGFSANVQIGAVTPNPVTPSSPSIFDMLKGGDMKGAFKAMGDNDMFKGGIAGLAGAFGGGQQQQQQEAPLEMTGGQDAGQAQIAPAAAQLMASLLAARRGKVGM